MDDDDFDPFDLSDPTALSLGIAGGLFDDDIECACTCGCDRLVAEEGDLCGPCRHDVHADSPERR